MSETNTFCIFCRNENPDSCCEECLEPLCVKCSETLNTDLFILTEGVSPFLNKVRFCPGCYDQIVTPEIEKNEELLNRAKEIHYWPRTYRGFVPVRKKAKYEVEIKNCRDEKEALLKLGVQTAKLGFNAMIRGEIKAHKVRNFGHQKMLWNGKALPANVNIEIVEKNDVDGYRD